MSNRTWTSLIPQELPICLFDCKIIDGSIAFLHQAIFVKLPVFIAIGAKPIAGIVVILICKTHCYPVARKRPKFFDQAVFQFSLPLFLQEGDDFGAAT